MVCSTGLKHARYTIAMSWYVLCGTQKGHAGLLGLLAFLAHGKHAVRIGLHGGSCSGSITLFALQSCRAFGIATRSEHWRGAASENSVTLVAREYEWIVKGGEELRIDQRMEQLLDVANGLLARNPSSASHRLQVPASTKGAGSVLMRSPCGMRVKGLSHPVSVCVFC